MASLTPRLDKIEINELLNGDFALWQRGTSSTSMASGSVTNAFSGTLQYLADRFGGFNKSGNNVNMSRSTDVPTFLQSGYQSNYSLLVTNSTGVSLTGSNVTMLAHRLEGYEYQKLHGQKARLQFWVKSSVTGTYSLALTNAAETRTYVTTYSIPVANTWTQIILDIQLDTTGTYNFDNLTGLQIIWNLGSGPTVKTSTLNTWQAGSFTAATGQAEWVATTSSTFQLAQVTLVGQDLSSLSSQPISFKRKHSSFQQEVAACQRYYEKSYAIETAPGTSVAYYQWIDGFNINGTQGISFPLKVTKRAAFTALAYDGPGTPNRVTTNNGNNRTAFSYNVGGSTNMFTIVMSESTLFLQFNWTADAEL